MPFPELEYGKLQILSLNIFIILFKASTLNPYHLKANLEEVEVSLRKTCDQSSLLANHILILLISILLMVKFLAGYLTLAANVIAMFSILTEALPHLLIPPILAQAIDHVLLSLLETILGFFTLYYHHAATANGKVGVLVIFLTSMTIKIGAAIATLNVYSDFYQHLKYPIYISYDSKDLLFE
ncbi:uncharacterized protein LOC106083695 [Stomoxys calcitrans]|uniref:uncharacterized protein LOC106083695 n=1 Tax=Stomoxys calcitrans TaxID=35570 RepID=UPI0027E2A49A|nr:uncharacterized protein LOC106083695 [Stomoxys calcitrans]XP_059218581.1 uncharacterized protein LOC106083695 [Stomoxys calcitrans]